MHEDDWLEMDYEDRTHLPDELDPEADGEPEDPPAEREPLLWEEYLR